MTDDLDPELAAEETVRFSLDGAGYEIDLTAEHAAQLRDQLAGYFGSARKAGSTGTRSAARSTPSRASSSASAGERAVGDAGDAVDSKAVREWAKAHGKPVSERGRIASSLLVEFTEAHSH